MLPKTLRFWPEMKTRRGLAVSWPRLALVDIGVLDCATGELLCGVDDAAERMSLIGISRQNLGVKHELAARSVNIGGGDQGLDADLWTAPALQEESTKG